MRKQLLSAFGCVVLTADGHRAIEILKDDKRHEVDAILLDCRGPDTDGRLWAINFKMARPEVPITLVGEDPLKISEALKRIASAILPEDTPSTVLLQWLVCSLGAREVRSPMLEREAG